MGALEKKKKKKRLLRATAFRGAVGRLTLSLSLSRSNEVSEEQAY